MVKIYALASRIKRIGLLLMVTAVSHNIYSQRFINGQREMGILVGASNYHGELAHGLNLNHTGLAGGVYFQRNFNSYFSWRISGTYQEISGTDAGHKTYNFRNLSFKTHVIDVSNVILFNFKPFGTHYYDEKFTPYFYTGVSFFHFDPRRLENNDIKLRNLRTEGQTKSYSQIQAAIPIGLGVHWIIKRGRLGSAIFGIEGCWRKTFTDYLDDVSGNYVDFAKLNAERGALAAEMAQPQTLVGQPVYREGTSRGDKHLGDWYYFLGFSLSYRFTPLICRVD